MRTLLAALVLALLVIPALAKGAAEKSSIAWLGSLDEGMKASAKLGKPILLVTLWGPGT